MPRRPRRRPRRRSRDRPTMATPPVAGPTPAADPANCQTFPALAGSIPRRRRWPETSVPPAGGVSSEMGNAEVRLPRLGLATIIGFAKDSHRRITFSALKVPVMAEPGKASKAEETKANSRQLYGTIAEELRKSEDSFSGDSDMLMQFT